MAPFPHLQALPSALAWLRFLQALGRSPLTLDAYSRALDAFLAFCARQGQDPEHAGLDFVALFLHAMRGQGWTEATLVQRLCVVRLWFDYLTGAGHRADNPIPRGVRPGGRYGSWSVSPAVSPAGAALLRRPRPFPWIPTDEEWLRFLQAVAPRPVRDRLLVAFAYSGALRRQELVGLAVADIDPAHRLLTVRPEVAKRNRGRVVSYPPQASPLLAAYLQHRRTLSREQGALFLSESNRSRGRPLSKWAWNDLVHEMATAAHLPGFTPHTFRHLRLTHLALKGLGLHEIATFAGHRSLESTMVYLHLSGRHIDGRIAGSILGIEAQTHELLGGGTR